MPERPPFHSEGGSISPFYEDEERDLRTKEIP